MILTDNPADVGRELLALARARLADDAAQALLLAAAAILDPIDDELAARGAAMLEHAVREALAAWHDPVGIIDASVPSASDAPLPRRRDRVKPGRADWQARAAAGRQPPRPGRSLRHHPFGGNRQQRSSPTPSQPRGLPPGAAGDAHPTLRARLLSVIGRTTGADRQCHLSVTEFAARAGADRDPVRRELVAMVRAGLISRFPHANGRVTTMLTAGGAATPEPAAAHRAGRPSCLTDPHEGDTP